MYSFCSLSLSVHHTNAVPSATSHPTCLHAVQSTSAGILYTRPAYADTALAETARARMQVGDALILIGKHLVSLGGLNITARTQYAGRSPRDPRPLSLSLALDRSCSCSVDYRVPHAGRPSHAS